MEKKELNSLTPEVVAEIDNLKHLFFLSDYATIGTFMRFTNYTFPQGLDHTMFENWNSEKKLFLDNKKKQYDALQGTYVDNLNTRLAFANKLMGLLENHIKNTHPVDMDGAEISKVARAFQQIAQVQDQTIASMNISPSLDGAYEETKSKVADILNVESLEYSEESQEYNDEVDAAIKANPHLFGIKMDGKA